MIKYATTILLSVLLLCNIAYAERDFRNSTWTNTKDMVKRSEDTELLRESPDHLFYRGTLLSYNVAIGYFFFEGELYNAKYILMDEFMTPGRYIDVYDEFVKTISRKYGEADKSTKWLDDMYKDHPEDWGTAIALGHLELKAGWRTGTTYIFAHLQGENAKVMIYVDYYTTDQSVLNRVNEARNKEEESQF